MQKSTTVFSVPLAELDEQLRDIATWPMILPQLESVTETSPGRYTFVVRREGGSHVVHVAVRRSPFGSGMIWTVVDGPAWNGHLYLQVVDARRTRVHLELNIEPRGPLLDVDAEIGDAGTAPAQLGLFRLQDVVAKRDDDREIQIPA
jgi:hypothetical protein